MICTHSCIILIFKLPREHIYRGLKNKKIIIVARSLASARVTVSKEPSDLSRSDGKRPDGLTLIPWRAGRSLIWDVIVSCTTADSYLEACFREADAAAELAASNKVVKYASWTLITG